MERSISVYIAEISPRANVVGTGPVDDDGLPEVTAADLARSEQQFANGEMYIFGRVQVFPDNLEQAYMSASSSDVEKTKKEVLAHLMEACKQLPW